MSEVFRVKCTFIDPAGQKVEEIRLPFSDPNTTVRHVSREALLRFISQRRDLKGVDIAITEATVDGDCVIFHGDKVQEAIDVKTEGVFLKLNMDVAAMEKKKVAYNAAQPTSRPEAAPAAAAATTTVMQREPVRGAEPCKDLLKQNAQEAKQKAIAEQKKEVRKSALHLTKDELRTPKDQPTDSTSPVPTPAPTGNTRKVAVKKEKPVAAKKDEKPKAPKQPTTMANIPCPATQKVNDGVQVVTPEEARDRHGMSKKEEAQFLKEKGEGWNAGSLAVYPTNYSADPDALARENRKRKRQEKEARQKRLANVTDEAAKAEVSEHAKTADKNKLTSCLSSAKVASTKTKTQNAKSVKIVDESSSVRQQAENTQKHAARPASSATAKINSETADALPMKAMKSELSRIFESAPSVNRSLNIEMDDAVTKKAAAAAAAAAAGNNNGNLYPGMPIMAREMGGQWYKATVKLVDKEHDLVRITWDCSGVECVVLRKNAKSREEAPEKKPFGMSDGQLVSCRQAAAKGNLCAGMPVHARQFGGSWFGAVVKLIDVESGSIVVNWDASQDDCVCIRKDVKPHPKLMALENDSKLNQVKTEKVKVKKEEAEEEAANVAQQPLADITNEHNVDGLQWGEKADLGFCRNTYMVDPSKAHLHLPDDIVNAPRSKRTVQTPEIFKNSRAF